MNRLVSPLLLTLGSAAMAQAPTPEQRVLLAQADLIAAITMPDQANQVRGWLDATVALALTAGPTVATHLAPAAQTLVMKAVDSLPPEWKQLQASLLRDLAGLLAITAEGGDANSEVRSLRRRSLVASATGPQQQLELRLLRQLREDKQVSSEPTPKVDRLDIWQQHQDQVLAEVLEGEAAITLRQSAFDQLAAAFRRLAEADVHEPKERVARLARFEKVTQQLLPELSQPSLASEPGQSTTQWPFTTLHLVLATAAAGAEPKSKDSAPALPTAKIHRLLENTWAPLTTWPGQTEPTPTTPAATRASVSLRLIAESGAIYWLCVTTPRGAVNVLLTWSSDAGARRLGNGTIKLTLPAEVPSREVLVAELRADGRCLLTKVACDPFSALDLKRLVEEDNTASDLRRSLSAVTERTQAVGADTARLLPAWLTEPRSDIIKLTLPTPSVNAVLTACAGTAPFDLHLDEDLQLFDRTTVVDDAKSYILIHTEEVRQ